MKLKQAAHAIAQKNHRWIHEVAIWGTIDVKGEWREGCTVIKTYARYGEVFRGVGVAYFNPQDLHFDKDTGYIMAEGEAELDLGILLLKNSIDFFDDWPDKIAAQIRLDSVHRLKDDRKWKEMSRPPEIEETSSEYIVVIGGREHRISRTKRRCSCGEPGCAGYRTVSSWVFEGYPRYCPVCGARRTERTDFANYWRCVKDSSHWHSWRVGQLRELASRNPPVGINKYLIECVNSKENEFVPFSFFDKE